MGSGPRRTTCFICGAELSRKKQADWTQNCSTECANKHRSIRIKEGKRARQIDAERTERHRASLARYMASRGRGWEAA